MQPGISNWGTTSGSCLFISRQVRHIFGLFTDNKHLKKYIFEKSVCVGRGKGQGGRGTTQLIFTCYSTAIARHSLVHFDYIHMSTNHR